MPSVFCSKPPTEGKHTVIHPKHFASHAKSEFVACFPSSFLTQGRVPASGCFCSGLQFMGADWMIRLGSLALAVLGLVMVVRVWRSEGRLAKGFRLEAVLATLLSFITIITIGYSTAPLFK